MPTSFLSRRTQGQLLRFLVGIIVLALAVLLASYWLRHKPHASKKVEIQPAALVTTQTLLPIQHQIVMRVMGTAIAARQVEMKAVVSGAVVSLSPKALPGGKFKAAEEILRLDARHYQLVISQKKSEVDLAEVDLALEQGQQRLARKEYRQSGKKISPEDRPLRLRAPQLKAAQAKLRKAKAALQLAKLDLSHTIISAPFNAVITERQVDVGANPMLGSPLVTVVGTDQFWVEIAIPLHLLDELEALAIAGAEVRIRQPQVWGESAFRTGTLQSLRVDVEPEGRMARGLVSVADPLCLQPKNHDQPRLLLTSYVHVELPGRVLSQVLRIPRSALHNGNEIWWLTAEQTLRMDQPTLLWQETQAVYIAATTRSLIISDLATPVAGMALRTQSLKP